MKLAIVENEADFKALKGSWDRLYVEAATACPFLDWEWLATWWHHFGENHRLFVITDFVGERLVAAAPFFILRRQHLSISFPTLSFIGDNDAAPDFLDLLIAPNHDREFLLKLSHFLQGCRYFSLVSLYGISSESPYKDFWLTLCNVQNLRSQTAIKCPITALPRSFEEYLATRSATTRYGIKRKLRKLSSELSWRLKVCKDADADYREAFRRFVHLNQLRIDDRSLQSAFRNDAFSAFHQEVFPKLLSRKMAEIHLITAAGTDLSALYFFKDPDARRYFYYQGGWSPEHRQFSPGMISMSSAIEYCIEAGSEEFHFLRGEEAYKSSWTSDAKELIAIHGFNHRTLKGRLAQGAASWKKRATAGVQT